MIILIDNYDSFSYNLYQMIGSIKPDIKVIRNDSYSCREIEEMRPDRIIISPGPGKPKDAGVCEDVIDYLKGKIPILGVCLGHQAICETFGASIIHAKKLMHGKQSECILNNNCKIFKTLPQRVKVARYHSLSVDASTIPDCIEVMAETSDGEIMAVKHKQFEIYGLQFHPESILTPDGMEMLKQFLDK